MLKLKFTHTDTAREYARHHCKHFCYPYHHVRMSSGKRKRVDAYDVSDPALVHVPRHYHSDSEEEPEFSLTTFIHDLVSSIMRNVVRTFRRIGFSQRRRIR